MSREELIHAYDRELRFIRRMAQGFARQYPEQASALQIEATKCDDPHVERLIESFALIAARIHQRVDDDFSEISKALIGILYPHYLSPVPSMTIVQLEMDKTTAPPPGGVRVPSGAVLRSDAADGVACRFRTAYPLALFPLEVVDVEVIPSNALGAPLPASARSSLRIHLRAPEDASIQKLGLSQLRFYLPGEGASVSRLYELLLRDPQGVLLQSIGPDGSGSRALLDAGAVQPVGFGREEGLLEYPTESFLGYRLLQEYFAFQEKFFFVEFSGLDRLQAGPDDCDLFLSVLLRESAADLELRFTPDEMKLGCTPAVNLFRQLAEPIRLTHRKAEYDVVPDIRTPRFHEVYSILGVTASRSGSSEDRQFVPFYALHHGDEQEANPGYWSHSRVETFQRSSSQDWDAKRSYPGTDVTLTLVDPDFDPDVPGDDIVNVEILATNRDLPSRLQIGGSESDFHLDRHPGVEVIRCVSRPTSSLASPVARGSRWQIVSHLALNYRSLTSEGGLTSLREILKLYDFADSPVTRRRISGLVGLQAKRVVRPIGRGATAGFARGLQVELEFDSSQFEASGMFLFASVLERFLGLYASVNSFTQTVAGVRGHEGILKRWPPRAGEQQIL